MIADTHGSVPDAVFGVFRRVDHILHGGDVGGSDVLVELESLAPVTAVFGNTDGHELRARLPQVAKLDLDGLYVTVTHGDQFGIPTPAALHNEFPSADIIVFGHTHDPVLRLIDETITVMNPGSASQPRGGLAPSVGIMELEPGLPPRARLVPLTG